MKIALFAAALMLPIAAGAQSLDQTHERIWHANGKVPALAYKPRAAAACRSAGLAHHPAGKLPAPAGRRCDAATSSSERLAAAAIAGSPTD